MSLFDINDINQKDIQGSSIKSTDGKIRYISESINADLEKAIGKINAGESIHFDTVNKWSLHDMVVYLLNQTGPAHLYFSTWSIKEYPARIITKLKIEGALKSLNALLDYRIQTTSPDAYQLLQNNCDKINLIRCHAKLTVIENNEFAISIVSSSNFTTNTRAECGVITENREVANYRKEWILKNINHA